MSNPVTGISETDFPELENEGYQITSPVDGEYNCIAWAAGDDSRWWEPESLVGYWPVSDASGITSDGKHFTFEALIRAFQALGYTECATPDFESDFEKIALYGPDDSAASHAARQVGPDKWASKLGPYEDIVHTLYGLAGPFYGLPRRFLRRRTNV